MVTLRVVKVFGGGGNWMREKHAFFLVAKRERERARLRGHSAIITTQRQQNHSFASVTSDDFSRAVRVCSMIVVTMFLTVLVLYTTQRSIDAKIFLYVHLDASGYVSRRYRPY